MDCPPSWGGQHMAQGQTRGRYMKRHNPKDDLAYNKSHCPTLVHSDASTP